MHDVAASNISVNIEMAVIGAPKSVGCWAKVVTTSNLLTQLLFRDYPMRNTTKFAATVLASLAFLGGCATTSQVANPVAPAAPAETATSAETAAPAPTKTQSAATLARFREGEIRDYQGTQLDPAIAARDNSIKGVQHVDLADYRLTVTGLVANPEELTYEQVTAMEPYERLITLNCIEGWSSTVLWKGTRLMELIDAAQPAPEVNTVIFHAVDGYTTSLPLEMIKDRDLILAYDANGLPLPEQMGFPFIVVAEDNIGYKWARWVTEIELSDDENYQGYWESRGYANDADIRGKYGQ